MPHDALHELPPSIELELVDAGELLGVLDEALELATGDLRTRIEVAKRLLIRKLWPDLGQLLDDDD